MHVRWTGEKLLRDFGHDQEDTRLASRGVAHVHNIGLRGCDDDGKLVGLQHLGRCCELVRTMNMRAAKVEAL